VVNKTWPIHEFSRGDGEVELQIVDPHQFVSYPYDRRLSASVDGEFFSIESIIDQWGTWYFLTLGDSEVYTYAQEHGTPSFLRGLIKGLTEFADASEPHVAE
jgi:hypothetical protein